MPELGGAMTRMGQKSAILGLGIMATSNLTATLTQDQMALKRFKGQLDMTNPALSTLAGALAGVQKAVIGTIALSAGVAAAFTIMTKQTVEFEKSLRNMMSVWVGGTGGENLRTMMYDMGEEAVQLSLRYNTSAANIAEGMYHLASAGLSEKEMFDVLTPTIALATATQGDYADISRDVIQVLRGFSMESDKAQMVADKYITIIQNSLVTWDQLGQGIKFAMPWFVGAGRTVDELVASIGFLSDRALEAGIAGRGMRQSLAMMLKYANDNAKSMRSLGIEILGVDGKLRPILDIARQMSEKYGGLTAEALIDMMDRLEVRGATAFAHLVDGVDAFEKKLNSLKDVEGRVQATAEAQMKSLSAQWTLLKNAFYAPFLQPKFIEMLQGLIKDLGPVILKLGQSFSYMLTTAGPMLTSMINLLTELTPLMQGIMIIAKVWLDTFYALDPTIMRVLITIWGLNKAFKIGSLFLYNYNLLTRAQVISTKELELAEIELSIAQNNARYVAIEKMMIDKQGMVLDYKKLELEQAVLMKRNAALIQQKEIITLETKHAGTKAVLAAAQNALNISMIGGSIAMMAYAEGMGWQADALAVLTGVLTGAAIAWNLYAAGQLTAMASTGVGIGVALAAMGTIAFIGDKMRKERRKMNAEMAGMKNLKPAQIEPYTSTKVTPAANIDWTTYSGGRETGEYVDEEISNIPAMASGGYVRESGLAMIHAGETVVPRGQGGEWYQH